MKMNNSALQPNFDNAENEWAVILAGGDGTRLRSLTRRIAGDERPKQFCPVLGRATLLEETQGRAALALAPQRTLYVVNRSHQFYYAPILTGESSKNLVVQPANRGTAPAILYSLLRIAAVNSDAIVAFFPSDHYISDNQRFMAHIRTALYAARRSPDSVILLGLEPESPEVEYGWIEPAEIIPGETHVRGVRRFWEKPDRRLAQVLQLRGCLWNSFVMVASARALLEIIESGIPELYRSLARVVPLLGTSGEPKMIDRIYARMEETSFSHQVLALHPDRLAVVKVTGVRWNDLGEPKRVMASLNMSGIRPHWAEAVALRVA
jgi:mannose-1-phosphate guanylyltransferase